MKNMVTFFTVTICLVLTVLTILTINNYQTRKNEIEETLASSLDQAIENLKLEENKYSPSEYQDFVSDLLQQILLQVNSDCDVKINILNIDLDTGILDLEVIEYYKWFGQTKTIAERRTVVLEEYKREEDVNIESAEPEQNKMVHVRFMSNGQLYTEITVPYGEPISKPVDPGVTNYSFKGWYIEGDSSRELLDDMDWEYLCPSEDMTFIAKFASLN